MIHPQHRHIGMWMQLSTSNPGMGNLLTITDHINRGLSLADHK